MGSEVKQTKPEICKENKAGALKSVLIMELQLSQQNYSYTF